MNYKPIRSVDFIVIHCAATRPSQDIGAKEIRRWHKERGWFDIGYHYVIRRDGDVEKGRPDDRPGAHARGFNERSLGICWVGGVAEDGKTPEDNRTPEQIEALATLLDQLTGLYPEAEVLGHRDLPNVKKACPSFDVRSWWAKEKERLNGEAKQGERSEHSLPSDQDEDAEAEAQRDLQPEGSVSHPPANALCLRRWFKR